MVATTSERTTSLPTTTNGHGPATPAQLAALEKFRAQIPPGLSKAEASDWMDLIHRRLTAKERLSPEDLSGPPSIRPASDLPPTGRLIDYSTPSPPPASEPAGPIDPLPSSDEWITVETEVSNDVGDGMHSRRYVKIAAHASPGEGYTQAAKRLMKKAEDGLWADPEPEKTDGPSGR